MKQKAIRRTELILLRVANDWTQQYTADALGVSVSTYNLLETGKRIGSIDLWKAIQKLFKLEDEQVWRIIINKQI